MHACFVPGMPQVHIFIVELRIEILIFKFIIKYLYFITRGKFSYIMIHNNYTFLMMQSELENLSFMYTNAEDYAKVKRRVADLYKEHEKELLEVMLVSVS